MKKTLSCTVLLSSTILYAAMPAALANDSLKILEWGPSASYTSIANGISANGKVIVGSGDNPSNSDALSWTNGAAPSVLEGLNGSIADEAEAYAVNSDGSVIVGYSLSAPNKRQATKWVNGTAIALDNMGYDSFSKAYAVNSLGDIAVGEIRVSAFNTLAVKWTGTAAQQLDHWGVGTTQSYAYGVSGDGNIAVGRSITNGGFDIEAVRWAGTTAQGLGFFTGATSNFSVANAISSDGSTIVGNGTDHNGNTQAFQWQDATSGLQGLGFISGGSYSNALAVNADGSVIVGYGENNAGLYRGFIWDKTNGMRDLNDILTQKGVNLGDWEIVNATGVSGNGEIVVGEIYDTDSGYISKAYMANLKTGGITTPDNTSDSLQSVEKANHVATQTGARFLGQSLYVARNMMAFSPPPAPSSMAAAATGVGSGNLNSAIGNGQDISASQRARVFALLTPAAGTPPLAYDWEFYTVGNIGLGADNDFNNQSYSGTAGFKRQLTKDFGIGLGILASTGEQKLDFGGESNMNAIGGNILAAYQPATGLRLYGSLFAADIKLDIDRGYLNGTGLDMSRGKTDGHAFGAAVQAGYAIPVDERNTLMPFIEGRWARTKTDAYNETGGSMTASFSSQKLDSSSVRIGIENTYQHNDRLQFTGSLAWGHRIDDGDGGLIGTSMGVSQPIMGDAGDRNWGEASLGANWKYTERTSFGAQLSGRTGKTAEPQVNILLSAGIKF